MYCVFTNLMVCLEEISNDVMNSYVFFSFYVRSSEAVHSRGNEPVGMRIRSNGIRCGGIERLVNEVIIVLLNDE